MDRSIEEILSILVIKVADHFGFEMQDAIAAVAESKTAEELTAHGEKENMSIEQICQKLYNEISLAG